MLRGPAKWLLPYAAICALMGWFVTKLPEGFLPQEDQGIGMVIWTLPPGATIDRTKVVAREVEKYYLGVEKKNVESIFTVAGFSFVGVGQNAGMGFIELTDWDKRKGKDNSAAAITGRATGMLQSIRDAFVFSLTPPAIQGVGQSEGFDLQLQATAGATRAELVAARNQLLGMAAGDKKLVAVRPGELPDTPQLKIDIDQAKAAAHGLSPIDIANTLSAAWRGMYVNDFIDRGRVKRLFLQGEGSSRAKPEDLGSWYVRGATGEMTPFSAFATTRWTHGAETQSR